MSAKKKTNRKKWIIIAVILIIAVAVIMGISMRNSKTIYESSQAKKGDISTYYSFSGNIETKNRQTVISSKMLQIKDIKVIEGDMVKEGDELIRTSAGDKILADINGEILHINVEENEQVMNGMTMIEIVDYDNLIISVKVDEYDLSAINVGDEATVKIGALDKETHGKISSISKEGETVNGVTFFTADIDLEKDETLRTGMSAEAKIINETVTGAVILPMNVLQFDNDNKPFVLVSDDNGKMVKKELTTGINDGVNVEIKKGLTEGETVYYLNNDSIAGNGFNAGFRGESDE